MENKFGELKRQRLPLIHIGVRYGRSKLGGYRLDQEECADSIKR